MHHGARGAYAPLRGLPPPFRFRSDNLKLRHPLTRCQPEHPPRYRSVTHYTLSRFPHTVRVGAEW
jgi:hypothetical protein